MYIREIVLLKVKTMVYSYEGILRIIKSAVYECVLYFTYVI